MDSDQQLKQTINKFFLEYRRTFESGDAAQVANFYRFPLHYYREDGSKEVMTRAAFESHVQKLLQVYQRLGVQQIVGTLASSEPLNAGCNLATVNWILLRDSAGKPEQVYAASTRYLLGHSSEGWLIDGLIAVDEARKVRAAWRAMK